MNKGNFLGDIYVKNVSFSKAVLWFRRELSIPMDVFNTCNAQGIQELKFTDAKKGERWTFLFSDVAEHGGERQFGQEPQWYFPISLAKIEKLK